MPSWILLTSTAFIYMLGGMTLIFAPSPVAELLGGPVAVPTWVVQMAGAAWCGFATLNWLSRGMVVGGIYGRPLIAANLVHALMVTLVLGKAISLGLLPRGLYSLAFAFGVLTVAHGARMYGQPPEGEFPAGGSGNKDVLEDVAP
jgi:hypothetical protein